MNAKHQGFVLGIVFLLCLSMASAFNYNVTLNSPADGSNITVHNAVLNASILNTLNPGGNTSNITFYNSTGGVINTSINVFNNTPVTYNWTNLSDGTYTWYAIATGLNGTGISANSSFTIDTTAPVVSNVTVTNVNSTRVTITWTTNTISNGSLNIGPSPSMGTVYPNATQSIQHAKTIVVNPATLYYFQITSVDVLGNSGVDSMRSFTSSGGSCFANATGATEVILLAVGIFAVLAVAFLFLDGDVFSIEYLASALIATIFVVTLVPVIC